MILFSSLLLPPAFDLRLVGDWVSKNSSYWLTVDGKGDFVWGSGLQTKTIYPEKGKVSIRKYRGVTIVICQATDLIAPPHIFRPTNFSRLKFQLEPSIPALIMNRQFALYRKGQGTTPK